MTTVELSRRLQRSEPRLRQVVIVLGAGIAVSVVPLLAGLLGSLILYVVVTPVHERLARVLPRRLSALVIAFGVLAALVGLGTWLVTTIVSEGSDALSSVPTRDVMTRMSNMHIGGVDVADFISSTVQSGLSWLTSHAAAWFGGATMTTLNIVIALFGLYYLLVGSAGLWTHVASILPVSRPIAELAASRFVEVTQALMVGTVLTAGVQGVLVGSAFSLAGLHPAVLWGFVTACVSLLPLFGSALVWGPGALVLLFAHRPTAALVLGLFGAGLVSNIDNVIRLMVYRRVSGIHPMATLVGAIAGIRVFGAIGAFVGPLVLSYFFELVHLYGDVRATQEQS